MERAFYWTGKAASAMLPAAWCAD